MSSTRIQPLAEHATRSRSLGLAAKAQRQGHRAGWRHHLGRFAAMGSANALGERVAEIVDAYVAAWNEDEPSRRVELLERCWAEDAIFRDPMSYVPGRGALDQHIATVRMLMSGARLERAGVVELCHDTVRFPWTIVDEEGNTFARGTNFGRVSGDGRVLDMVGFFEGSALGGKP